MFNLEQSITAWRKQMLAAGIKTPVPMDELESHLRDEIEEQVKLRLSPEQAFRKGILKFGNACTLKNEFEKNNQTKLMKKIIFISLGILGILIGIGFVMPAVAQYRNEGALKNDEPLLLVLGTILTLGGIVAAFKGVKTRKA